MTVARSGKRSCVVSLALAAALASGCAKEPDPDWVLVSNDVYLNPSTIKQRDGHTSAWFDHRVEPPAIFFWASPKHRFHLEAIDCQNGRMARMATRQAWGRIYEPTADTQKLHFEYVMPDSLALDMVNAVCKAQL